MQPSYTDVFSFEHLVASAEECIKGVSWKQSVQSFASMIYIWCIRLAHQLYAKMYKSKGFTDFYISERGKTRHIQSVHISERVVQKTLCQYGLRPILEPSLIFDNAASISGKGTGFAIKRFREHLRWHYARHGLSGGIIIGDFHSFFETIDHDILLEKLRTKIRDDDIFELTKYFITCFPGGSGLGLGSEISQICAIYYLNSFDHILKERYGIHGYARYMDDFYIISEDLSKLRNLYRVIFEMAEELKMTLNADRTRLYEFADIPTFSYLKSRTRLEPNGRISMRLSSDNVKRRRSWLRKQKKMLDEGIIDLDYILQSQRIWEGYALKHKQSYTSVQSMRYYKNKLLRR